MRLEGKALAGYFPTPEHLLPAIAGLVTFEPRSYYGQSVYPVLDPFAGTGDALRGLAAEWARRQSGQINLRFSACELEHRRFVELRKIGLDWQPIPLEGDAFCLSWSDNDQGAGVLFLNPPYDTDPEEGRLEQRCLRRFTPALSVGGVLIFVLPAPSVEASALYLARHYKELRMLRFPDDDFATFGQVVIVAKRSHLADDAQERAQALIRRAADPGSIPVLGSSEAGAEAHRLTRAAYRLFWSLQPFDRTAALEHVRPWEGCAVGVDRSMEDLLGSTFPVALPPKPAHVALALTSGHLDGHRLEPNAGAGRFPPILLKGMFGKEQVLLDEKMDEEGEVAKATYVERPTLKMSAIRLDDFRFVEIRPGVELSEAQDLEGANVRDVFGRYSESIGELMAKQFPPLHHPERAEDQIRLPALPRAPFEIQRHAIQASLKILAGGFNPPNLAEVGCGKSTVALYLWAALTPRFRSETVSELARIGINTDRLPAVERLLVVCPPHLVDTWEEEIAAVVPWARVQVLRRIADVWKEADIYVLSREAAKLGHAVVGVEKYCPRCGQPFHPEQEKKDRAAKRAICQRWERYPANLWAILAQELAEALLPVLWRDETIRQVVRGRVLRTWALRQENDATRQEPARPLDLDRVRAVMGHRSGPTESDQHPTLRALALLRLEESNKVRDYYARPLDALCDLALALGDHEALAVSASLLEGIGSAATDDRWTVKSYAREAALNLRAAAQAESPDPSARIGLLQRAWSIVHGLAKWTDRPAYIKSRVRHRPRIILDPQEPEDSAVEICGEPLYCAVPEPRRYPLAKYICRHAPERFHMLVQDEVHEFGNQGTAQELAGHRLAELNIPVIALTGSLMSGYASSLYRNWWSLDREFRKEYAYGDRARFVQEFGFRKLTYSPPKSKDGHNRGAVTDLRHWNCRVAGEAPGVMPVFLMRHLLKRGVVMHKSELDQELPPMTETPITLEVETDMDRELMEEFESLTQILVDRITEDMFTPGLSGKLWGALMELPSYLDRCTEDQGQFVLRYPESVGGAVVLRGRMFPASYQTPKERAMVRALRGELKAGRRAMVFCRHVSRGLPQRLKRIIEREVTERVAILDAKKVGAQGRKKWIQDSIVGPGVEVMIVNPAAIKTGLNVLTHFATAWWHEPDYSAQTYRQANGRLHRVGQELPVSILFPVYPDTAQAIAVDLLARKVTASLQVDGLTITGALEAAGAGEDAQEMVEAQMAMGQAMYEALLRRPRNL